MTEQEVYLQLKNKAAKSYRLNEIIPFSYPVRRIIMDVVVDKQPDSSLLKVYSVLLRAIKTGFMQQETLFQFLGLGHTDEFILRELFALREKGLIDLVSENWFITPEGDTFIQNNAVMRVEEEEEYQFLIDGVTGDILSANEYKTDKNKLPKSIDSELKISKKSDLLLDGKFQQLADVYRKDHQSNAYLIGYEDNEIKKDFEDYCHYWLVEYIPERITDSEPHIEVRTYDDALKLNRQLTEKFNAEYRHVIYTLSNVERQAAEEIIQIFDERTEPLPESVDFKNLSIWETKQQFVEALQNVKERILIESPWIKRATQEYLPYFERMLKDKKQLVILYGISENDEHDISTLKKVEELQRQYPEQFTLIHLPTHFLARNSRLTGTHRKLVIKDNEYYIAGSFNFLSFGKNEKQQVANEESTLFTKNVNQRWEKVLIEYELKG
jgi:hypothetical protein